MTPKQPGALAVSGTAELAEILTEQAIELHARRRAESTRDAYAKDWAMFEAFCAQVGAPSSLPADPATIAQFIAAHTLTDPPAAVATVDRRLAAIRAAHVDQGYESPTDHSVIVGVRKGMRRTRGVAPERQATPLLTEDLRTVLKQIDNSLIGRRDKALLLIGFTGAFRRSEIVALRTEHLHRDQRGYRILLSHSKTDQEGEGLDKGIPRGKGVTCPVTALDRWLEHSGITEGVIFRSITRTGRLSESPLSAQSVALIIKRRVEAVGLDKRLFAGHSLRAGNVTTLARNGVPLQDIMTVTGHKNLRTVVRYVRREEALSENAAVRKLGL